jgi:hypothetical protein
VITAGTRLITAAARAAAAAFSTPGLAAAGSTLAFGRTGISTTADAADLSASVAPGPTAIESLLDAPATTTGGNDHAVRKAGTALAYVGGTSAAVAADRVTAEDLASVTPTVVAAGAICTVRCASAFAADEDC